MLTWQFKKFDDLTLTELYNIMRVRQEVFVVEQNCPFVDADGEDIGAYHLSGFVNGGLAAYSRIIPPGQIYTEPSIGREITAGKYRTQGYGKLLMEQSIYELENLYGKTSIRIGAQLYLKKFYGNFGFVQQGEVYILDGIDHIEMIRIPK